MLNQISIMGRPVHTPEVKEGQSGTKFARLRIACDRDFTGQDGENADFFDITAFGKTADFVEKFVQKGRLFVIVGRLQNRNFTDKDGNKRTASQIVADRFYFADSPRSEEKPKPEPFEMKPVPPMKPETKAFGDRILEQMKEPLVPVEVEDGDLPF